MDIPLDIDVAEVCPSNKDGIPSKAIDISSRLNLKRSISARQLPTEWQFQAFEDVLTDWTPQMKMVESLKRVKESPYSKKTVKRTRQSQMLFQTKPGCDAK